MSKSLLTTTITLAVAVIVIGAFLMPVISDASTEEKTGTNPYGTRMKEIGSDTVTLTYVDSKALFNGEELQVTDSDGSAVDQYCIVADSFIIQHYSGGAWFYYLIDGDTVIQVYSTATGTTTSSAVIGDGKITLTIGSTVHEVDYQYCYIPDDKGQYMTSYNQDPSAINVVVPDSRDIIVFSSARTSCGVSYGSLKDGFTTSFHITDGAIDTDTYTYSVSYDDYKAGNTTLAQITGNVLVVAPLTYQYEQDTSLTPLYTAIPIIVIAGLLLLAVGIVIGRRE